jgi:dipeptidyl-peptidase-4
VFATTFVALVACGSPPPPSAPAASAPESTAPPAPIDTSFLEQYSKTNGFNLGRPASVEPTPSGDAVLFLRSGPESFERDLFAFDAATKTEKTLLTAQQILQGGAERLSPEERARRERMRMTARGIASYELSDDGTRILVPLSGRLFVVERATGAVSELGGDASPPIDPHFSPDGQKVSFVRQGDLYVTEIESGQERRLTSTAAGALQNALAEFVAQEEMGRMQGSWWSPDSRNVAYEEADASGVEVLHVSNPAAPEEEPSASPYPRAGRENVKVRLGVVPASGGTTTWVEWDRARFPYLAKVVWEDAAPLTILVQNRRQTEEALLAVDVATGRTSEILVERDDAWLNLDRDVPHWLPDGRSFLWTTERGGAWQLELRGADGRLERTLTPPDFGYRGLVDVDETRRTAIVRASAEPTESHLFRVPFDGAAPERLTKRPGEHDAVFAKEHGLWVHRISTKSGVEKQVVTRADGTALGEIRSVAETPAIRPRVEWTQVGPDDFRAIVVRPRDFAPGRRYPVIAAVYGGPTARVVGSTLRRYLLDQWLADQGFVVVALDGRGTPDRGRAWERTVRGRFGEVPLAEQVAGLRALGAKYPEMDMTRVGVFGWSFGGYLSALAVLRRPDVFRAAVAGAPVADWRDYDTHYTERYLGLPDTDAAAYDSSSLLTYAADLSRPLLVVHGTVDDNVLFTHSVKLCDALFRAGRPFEFLPLSGFTHMVPDPVVTSRLHARIADFFRQNL